MNKNINTKLNHVTANLVATYDLSPDNASSVKNIDYLCVYEYEYEGKIYKYRTHQKDTFSPIPEIIELGFTNDPSSVYKVNTSSQNRLQKSLTSVKAGLLIWGILILMCLIIIYFAYNMVKSLFGDGVSLIGLLIIIVLFVLIVIKSKKQKNGKNTDEIIEDAILNNRVVTAVLIKIDKRNYVFIDNPRLKVTYKETPYRGKYKYIYNGKKYTMWRYFSNYPPSTMKLFLGKNPRDIVFSTYPKQ